MSAEPAALQVAERDVVRRAQAGGCVGGPAKLLLSQQGELMMDSQEQAALLERIATLIAERYVFAERGTAIAEQLHQRYSAEPQRFKLEPAALATRLTEELYAISQDSHLRLRYEPEMPGSGADHEALMQRHFERARRNNFGFVQVARLAGNIGLLDLRELPPPEDTQDLAVAAMAFVAHMQALIIDLRENLGGTPGMIQLLISYLVGEEPQPLSGIYCRQEDRLTRAYTLPEVPGRRMPDVPVYVLVSGRTHSAAEALAYDLQMLRRATIIGEPTRGGAHLIDFVVLGESLVLSLPVCRAVNPISGQNWQGTGVIPDLAVPAEQALSIAHRRALDELLARASDEAERAFLSAELAALQAAERPELRD